MKSSYKNFNVLDKWNTADWDEPTREAVRKRLDEIPPYRFFNEEELSTLEAVADRIVPQDEDGTLAGRKIPIIPWIDEKLYLDERNGYRYESLPPQRECWKLGITGIDQTSETLFDGKRFSVLAEEQQDEVLRQIQNGNPPGEIWKRLNAAMFFRNVLSITIAKIYYSHPIAWNEIGYNGPSAIRGHVRKAEGGVDPWEAEEDENA